MRALQECNNITKMEQIIRNAMPQALENSINPNSKLMLMDGFPRQNSKLAWKALPPRSPDLNPIENFLNLVVRKLTKQVLDKQIESETYDAFRQRVQSVMLNFSVKKINRIIESMSRRIDMVIKENGCRIKY